MSDRELKYLTDFTALMATRKYGKVPPGHPIGSQLGVRFDSSQNRLHFAAARRLFAACRAKVPNSILKRLPENELGGRYRHGADERVSASALAGALGS